MGTPIRFVDYGVANNFGTYIEINKDLKKYPKLYKSIRKHELEHSKRKSFFSNFWLDFSNIHNTKDYLVFVLNHPRSWIQFSPLYKTKKGFFLDINLLIIEIFETILIVSGYVLLSRII
jgi:hypothetical protein